MPEIKRYCLALDLKPDATSIAAYETHHQAVWPGILKSITDSGILHMEIYRIDNRLFLIMETGADFSFEKKNQMDAANPVVQEWEELMSKYQQSIPGAKPGEKWVIMNKIFEL